MNTIPPQLESIIRSKLWALVETNTDYVLHTIAREIADEDGAIRLTYEVWYVIPDQFDCTDFGCVWHETAIMWIDPRVVGLWGEYPVRGSHFQWRELSSHLVNIRDPDIPSEAVPIWLSWMKLNGHWGDLIEYYEEEGNAFLKGYPRWVHKAFRDAKAFQRMVDSLPRPVSRGGCTTGMGIFTLDEYREFAQEANRGET